MTRQLARAYAATGAILVLFLAWAVISASPWSTASASADPRAAALQAREAKLRHEAVVVRREVRHRWAVYRVRLAHRQHEIGVAERAHQRQVASARAAAASAASYSAPSVAVVQLPALTVTRTS
jgi:hypothetical protein